MMREDNLFWKPFSEYVAEAMEDQGDKDGDPADNQPLHPLEYALSYEWKDMANHLINESNANRPGPFGRTPLVKACRVNMPETVERLLQAGADLTTTYPDKQTPLHMAAWYGIEETDKVLLSHGADLSAQDGAGWTPLHAASVRGNLKCCEVLIRSGADLTVKDSNGMNALHLTCCETGQTEVAKLILQNGPEGMALEQCTVGPPLHFTCATGDIETTKVLLDYGGAA
jgi:ankyrin repeat protein